jgi:hypothetical protein
MVLRHRHGNVVSLHVRRGNWRMSELREYRACNILGVPSHAAAKWDETLARLRQML